MGSGTKGKSQTMSSEQTTATPSTAHRSRETIIMVEGLEKQAYDKNGEPDKTSGLDHVNDAAGYAVFYKWPVRGRGMQKIRLGGI